MRLKSFKSLCLVAAAAMLAQASHTGPAHAQACTAEQFATAVDDAGAALREIMRQNQPRLEGRIKALATKNGWTDAVAEEKAFELLADKRTTEMDRVANDLLARIDELSVTKAGAAPECGRLQELQAASVELQAAVKAKSAYMIARADALVTGDKPVATAKAVPPPVTAPAVVAAPISPPPPLPPPPATTWATTTTSEPPPQAPAPREEDTFTIDEIVGASGGLFGKVSAGLGGIVEHAFSSIGRPTGYILGEEGGGAFLAGLRYGRGTLYMRDGRTLPVFWHGPSIGWDFGAQGAKVMFLVYRLRDPEQLMLSFTALEGSAFVAGGLGMTLMTNGAVQLSPIRSGLGLRLGASVGYVRFTRKATWNPF